MSHHLTVVGAASSAGAYGPGQETAPAAFRQHGLFTALHDAGLEVTDVGDVVHEVFRQDPDHPEGRNPETVARVARTVADAVDGPLERGERVLVLGGDCTVEIGTVAGARRSADRVGLVYIDYDADLHVPETGEGALDWMGVGHLLGLPGAVPQIAGLGDRTPLLAPEEVLFLAADNVTAPERVTVERLGLQRVSVQECRTDPDSVVARVAEWTEHLDRIVVHVDIDVLDARLFRIAENTREIDGLDVDTLERLLVGVCGIEKTAAVTICEVNPANATDPQAQFARLVTMLTSALTPPSTH